MYFVPSTRTPVLRRTPRTKRVKICRTRPDRKAGHRELGTWRVVGQGLRPDRLSQGAGWNRRGRRFRWLVTSGHDWTGQHPAPRGRRTRRERRNQATLAVASQRRPEAGLIDRLRHEVGLVQEPTARPVPRTRQTPVRYSVFSGGDALGHDDPGGRARCLLPEVLVALRGPSCLAPGFGLPESNSQPDNRFPENGSDQRNSPAATAVSRTGLANPVATAGRTAKAVAKPDSGT